MQVEKLYKTIDVAKGNMCYQFLENREQGLENELIFLIHGLGCNKESFRDIWRNQAFTEYAIAAVDLMGYGDSEAPEKFSFDMKDQALCCFELIKSMEYTKIHIVAHSMGGAVGILLSELIESSELELKSFTSIEGNFISEDCGLISRKIVGMDYDFFESKHFVYLNKSSKNSEDPGVFEWSKQLKYASSLAFYRSAYSLVKWSDSGVLLKTFDRLTAHKRYIYGKKTGVISVLKCLDPKICFSIPDAGHFVMLENPKLFYQRLENCLSE